MRDLRHKSLLSCLFAVLSHLVYVVFLFDRFFDLRRQHFWTVAFLGSNLPRFYSAAALSLFERRVVNKTQLLHFPSTYCERLAKTIPGMNSIPFE